MGANLPAAGHGFRPIEFEGDVVSDGAIDGVFGQRTTAGVRAFQDARGLAIDGVVGARTKGELASLHSAATSGSILAADGSLLARGVSSATVRALQAVLDLLGFDPGPIDGHFGPLTGQAVMSFQERHDLTVDGIVGEQSRAQLTHQLDLQDYVNCD